MTGKNIDKTKVIWYNLSLLDQKSLIGIMGL